MWWLKPWITTKSLMKGFRFNIKMNAKLREMEIGMFSFVKSLNQSWEMKSGEEKDHQLLINTNLLRSHFCNWIYVGLWSKLKNIYWIIATSCHLMIHFPSSNNWPYCDNLMTPVPCLLPRAISISIYYNWDLQQNFYEVLNNLKLLPPIRL